MSKVIKERTMLAPGKPALKSRKNPMQMETVVEHDYKMEIGGSIWIIPSVTFIRKINGELEISFQDLLKFQQAVAIKICGEDRELTVSEFELLCSVCSTRIVELAKALRISHSTISKWAKIKPEEDPRNKMISYVDSFFLRAYFLKKLAIETDSERYELQNLSNWLLKKKHLPFLDKSRIQLIG